MAGWKIGEPLLSAAADPMQSTEELISCSHFEKCGTGPARINVREIDQRRQSGLTQSAEQAQQAVKDGERMRRAAGDEKVHGNDSTGAVIDLGVADKGPARNGTRSDRDDEPGVGHGLIGLSEGQFHVL